MVTITGRDGAIKWGYRVVASLASWSMSDGTLTAQLADCDETGIEQDPLVVTVPVGSRVWRVPVLSLSRDGATLTASVGPVEG